MNKLLKILPLSLLFFLGSCGLTDLEEQLDNPNEVTVDNLDITLLMNKIQADFGDFVSQVNEDALQLCRMLALIGGDTYQVAYQATDHNDIWERAYQDVLVQIETLLPVTDEEGFTLFSGSARVMKAYVLMTLVDLFGDVPYSEALQGVGNFNPKPDDGSAVYKEVISILDQAIADLNTTSTVGGTYRDIFYDGNASKWIALANTLKLKANINLRLTEGTTSTSAIEALLGADLIDTDAEEFTYKFGSSDVPSRSRHPLYLDMYQPIAGSADNYINNYYMLISYQQKGVEDPRWRYYFYRQIGSIDAALNDEPESIPCVISPRPAHYGPDQAWCAFDPGFFGRDHGNSDGLPPDTRAKTCVGVYPCGGRADTNADDPNYLVVTQQGQGANGAGIHPIWMASFTDFLKAEAALMLGTSGDDAALLESGVRKSIERTQAFGASKGQTVPADLVASTDDYVAKVNELYANAATPDAKLDVMMKEYLIALWGNGIEGYNMYRRTGKPSDMQPMRAANPGNFVYSLIYPADFVSLNSNATQKDPTAANKVFWDNNPDNFIK
ncbi:MAG TPA: SusD/RagB family nutrient-binding outer membrane lipoprotein [Saprospiraceae bacterium]|nr:SusD/RagB family nutrient-binding outer membrane lipoprotein [Saprospiraceae bacterium]HMQ81780.1 SusD/RagB family nutrient-binding outer membrane lipoprotein [Saprospiraceae bacterium]